MSEADEARDIVEQILRGAVPETRSGIFISDLVVQAREFEVEADIVEREDDMFPCIRRPDDTLTPIAFSELGSYRFGAGAAARGRPMAFLREREAEEGIRFVPVYVARDYLRDGMTGFLASRIRSHFDDEPAVRLHRVTLQLPQVSGFGFSALRLSTSGFTVTVSTRTAGLRIHSSPTFRRSWSYFGGPPTPIKSSLPGGIYEFGADGGAYTSITPDSGSFDIPYKTTTPSLTL